MARSKRRGRRIMRDYSFAGNYWKCTYRKSPLSYWPAISDEDNTILVDSDGWMQARYVKRFK